MTEKNNPTKEKILLVALSLIKEKGYTQVTIKDLCDASGISKHTFYYYFKSKEEVLMRFFHIPYEITAQRMADIMAMQSPLQQFWHLTEPRIDHFAKLGQEIVKQVTIINLQRNNSIYKTHKEKSPFFQLEIDLIAKAQELGEIRNRSDSTDLIKAVLKLFLGCVQFWTITGSEHDLKQEIKRLVFVLFDVRDDLRDNEEVQFCCAADKE